MKKPHKNITFLLILALCVPFCRDMYAENVVDKCFGVVCRNSVKVAATLLGVAMATELGQRYLRKKITKLKVENATLPKDNAKAKNNEWWIETLENIEEGATYLKYVDLGLLIASLCLMIDKKSTTYLPKETYQNGNTISSFITRKADGRFKIQLTTPHG